MQVLWDVTTVVAMIALLVSALLFAAAVNQRRKWRDLKKRVWGRLFSD